MKTVTFLFLFSVVSLSLSQTDSLIISGAVSDMDGRIPEQLLAHLSQVPIENQKFSFTAEAGTFALVVYINETAVDAGAKIPSGFHLSRPSNNPGGQGSSGPTLYLDLAQASDLDVTIYNIMGQRVAQIGSTAL